jgi:hypothetical protein
MNKNINNGMDRRKFNFNLLIVTMLIVVFSIQLYNQKLLIHNADRILSLELMVHNYMEPSLPMFNE